MFGSWPMKIERGVVVPAWHKTSVTDAELVALHVGERLTLSQVGARVGLTRERIRQRVRRAGVPQLTTDRIRRECTTRLEKWACPHCGREVAGQPHKRGSYCSPECVQKANVRWTPGELLAHLAQLAKTIGHTPSTLDLAAHAPPAHTAYYRAFGSLTEAQRLAGLIPNERGQRARAVPHA